ncbi:MAG: peptide chain release factor N(5)-glutamine methyltransferase [Pseudomonadota bacterium]
MNDGTFGAILASATGELKAAGVPDAARDARRLLAAAARVAPDRLTLMRAEQVGDASIVRLNEMIAQRCRRQPVSQILGYRDFFGRRFSVSPAVLDPRPETETLVAAALRARIGRVLDLGTGSGCILLSLLAEAPAAHGLGSDVSDDALRVAEKNAESLGLEGRARFQRADWWAGITGQFDTIVANPPYIARHEMAALAPEVREWEPVQALTDGADGLGAYRVIASGARAKMTEDARLLVEVGPDQAAVVASLFSDAGLEAIAVDTDLDGRDRVVSARNGPEKR